MTENSIVEAKPAFVCPDCNKNYTVGEADKSGSFCSEESCKDNVTMLEQIAPKIPEGEEFYETPARREGHLGPG